MNIKILEMLKEWNNISRKYKSFSAYIDTVCPIREQLKNDYKKIKNWKTIPNFFSYAALCIIPNGITIAIIVVIMNLIFGFSQFQNYANFTLSFIFSIPIGFFLTHLMLKKEIEKNEAIVKDFEEKILPFMKNNESISQFLPEFKEYCILLNQEEVFNGFIFRTLNDQVLYTDITHVFEFFTYYFNKNVNVDNYSEIIQAINEIKGVTPKENTQENITFFNAT